MNALTAALVALGLAVLHAVTIGINAWIAQYQLNKQTKDIAAYHNAALDTMAASLAQVKAKSLKKGE